jgi:hypothetical protein
VTLPGEHPAGQLVHPLIGKARDRVDRRLMDGLDRRERLFVNNTLGPRALGVGSRRLITGYRQAVLARCTCLSDARGSVLLGCPNEILQSLLDNEQLPQADVIGFIHRKSRNALCRVPSGSIAADFSGAGFRAGM